MGKPIQLVSLIRLVSIRSQNRLRVLQLPPKYRLRDSRFRLAQRSQLAVLEFGEFGAQWGAMLNMWLVKL